MRKLLGIAAALAAGCGVPGTERVGAQVQGVAVGYGEACDGETASQRADADLTIECTRLSGSRCEMTLPTQCLHARVADCLSVGTRCMRQGTFSASAERAPSLRTGAGKVGDMAPGCSRDEANAAAAERTNLLCRGRAGGDCLSFDAATCIDRLDSACPRGSTTQMNGSLCFAVGLWEATGGPAGPAPASGGRPAAQEPPPTQEAAPPQPCLANFCQPNMGDCDYQKICLRANGMQRRCDDWNEGSSPECSGAAAAAGTCPPSWCNPLDDFCDYFGRCTNDAGQLDECTNGDEQRSRPCAGYGGQPTDPPPADPPPAAGDPCAAYDWQNKCRPCDTVNHNGDGCCIDDFEGDLYCGPWCGDIDWNVFCDWCWSDPEAASRDQCCQQCE